MEKRKQAGIKQEIAARQYQFVEKVYVMEISDQKRPVFGDRTKG